MTCDKLSFILGMVTAFCECVAGGCKRLALSPPLKPEVYACLEAEALRIVAGHGLIAFHERNAELPEAERFEWLLIAALAGDDRPLPCPAGRIQPQYVPTPHQRL